MDQTLARRVLAAGLTLGVLSEIVLDGSAYGLNIVVIVAATLGAGWLIRRRGRAPDPLDGWLPVTALVLAAFVALRGDPFMAFIDTSGAFAFAGASLVAFSGTPVTRRFASVIAMMGTLALGAALAGAIRVIGLARPSSMPGSVFLPEAWHPWCAAWSSGCRSPRSSPSCSPPPTRSSGGRCPTLLGWRIDFGDLGGRMVFALACAWLAAGALSIAAAGLPDGRAILARRRRAEHGRDPVGAARADRGARRTGHDRPRDRRLRRAPDRLPVRRRGYPRGGRSDLQRLRAARLLRTGGRGLSGRRGRRRAGGCGGRSKSRRTLAA